MAYLDKTGLARFKENLIQVIDARSNLDQVKTSIEDEVLEAANRVSDVDVDPEVATVERLQTAVSALESNLGGLEANKLDKTTAHITETWSSGSSWYRKWSDGFVEQGFLSPNVTTTSGSGGFTISLITPMPSNNYILVAVPLDSDTSISAGLMVKSKTTTSCNVGAYGNYSPFMVYVAGY